MTAETQVPESVMRRLKKLLAMATDGRGNDAEATNAMRMAQKLMAEYNLSQGTLAASEVGEARMGTSRADTPPPWESYLLSEICRAFGARQVWYPGAGPRGYRSKGAHGVVAPKVTLELITYAFDVLRRQLIKARTEYVAALPEWWTRPRKAAEGDAFGIGFVRSLSTKISDYVGDPAVAEAIKLRHEEIVGDRQAKNKKADRPQSYDADVAGREAGKHASLHRAMNGAEEQLRIGA